MPLRIGEVLNNRYRIVVQLGKGGFGAVYRAWDTNLNGPCAVKENLDISSAGQKQFAREASLLFNLRHPNLPRVFDTFIVEGQGQYLVMDYIQGEDLQSMLDHTGGPLPLEQVLTWIDQVSEALVYLHSQDPPIIHRDIKPANIRIPPAGEAMLVDFGIAKVYDPHLKTTLGAQAVTPGYSPPEQYGSGKTDASSDVYALGATTYTLLTGEVPPASVDIFAGLASAPRPVHEVNPKIPVQVGVAIENAMRPNRTARLNAVSGLKEALLARPDDLDEATLISKRTVVMPREDSIPVPPTAVEHAPPVSPMPSESAAPPPVASSVAPVSATPSAAVTPAVSAELPSEPVGKPRRRFFWLVGLLVVCGLVIGLGAVALLTGVFSDDGSAIPANGVDLPPEDALAGQIELWHGYEPQGIEEMILIEALEGLQGEFPDLNVQLRTFPPEEIMHEYPQVVAEGGGPDLLLHSNKDLGLWAREGLVLNLDEYLQGGLEDYHDVGLEGMLVDGGFFGVPHSAQAVALYYNRSIIDHPPENFEELFVMVQDGAILASGLNSYHLFGWTAAFGGELLDDEGRCVADRGGWADALHHLLELKEAGAVFDVDFAMVEDRFRRGEVAMFVNGPWALGDYQDSLGDSLGIALMPAGPAGPARPWTEIVGFFVNPNSENLYTAVDLALFLGNQGISQRFADEARFVPVRLDVAIEDPILAGLTEAAWTGYPYQHIPEIANYWEPFFDMFIWVLHEGVPPEDAVAEACRMMNEANGK